MGSKKKPSTVNLILDVKTKKPFEGVTVEAHFHYLHVFISFQGFCTEDIKEYGDLFDKRRQSYSPQPPIGGI